MQAAPSHGPAPSTRFAFSLMELLISMGIIAVLAGLLIPAVKGVVLTGKSSKDAANLRQIAMANIAYAADNNQQCVVGYTSVPGGLGKVWYTELRPYLGKEDVSREGEVPVLISPNDPTKGGMTGPNAVPAGSWSRRSYGINYYTREYVVGSGSEYRGRRMAALPQSTMIFVGNYPAVQMNSHGISPNAVDSLLGLPRNWHGTRDLAQFVFLDGHVEMIDVDDLLPEGKRFEEAWGPVPIPVSR